MGKRIISQARGKGSLTYRVRKKAFQHRIGYPMHEGEAVIVKIFHSPAHYAPLVKAKIADEIFYNAAFEGAFEGQKINIGNSEIKLGNILSLKEIPSGTNIFNIENNPGDGGKMIRSSGSSATVNKPYDNGKIGIIMPNKKEIMVAGDCRATIGIVAGDGRKQKPFVKAGRKYYKMKARSKLWPRVSAVAVNAIDHPFGSGRGKRVKSKTVKRNAPPGRKVGHLRPRRTGRKKR
ncbi:MAG: 50S ribosomal protein L2 [Candidatus Pacearchaeota archaeon]|nr:50S ribosomal protein L2 [Candidatus Pacearchaeota archaeon]MDZ4226811.1 50S ribosomal protein L2 [Candidatus Pacearchaeota archaeon]